jgi:hypothetical protein
MELNAPADRSPIFLYSLTRWPIWIELVIGAVGYDLRSSDE